jgi:hypothetical protein
MNKNQTTKAKLLSFFVSESVFPLASVFPARNNTFLFLKTFRKLDHFHPSILSDHEFRPRSGLSENWIHKNQLLLVVTAFLFIRDAGGVGCVGEGGERMRKKRIRERERERERDRDRERERVRVS